MVGTALHAAPNRLFEVIASHWGPENAHAVMQRVIRSRTTPSSVTNRPPNVSPTLQPMPLPHGHNTIDERHQEPKRQRTKPKTSQQSSLPRTSAGSRTGPETGKRRGLEGKWSVGDAAPMGDVTRDGESKGKGSEVGTVGKGSGSVRTRKGKKKERGWGWSSWWQ